MPVGPSILWAEKARKSQSHLATSVLKCGTHWAPSTRQRAPFPRASATSFSTGLTVPKALETAVNATSLVLGVMIREAVTRHFGVWREADNGIDKVFDPLIGKNTEVSVVQRRYRPTHAVGHLRYLECGALDPSGQPVQDLVPWTDVYFPYDPALADRAELASLPSTRRPELMANEIAETYTYAADGTISVRIDNVSGGYGRTFELGALR